MSSLEGIVRPFQTQDVSPPKVLPAAGATATPADLVLDLGADGNTRTFSGNFNFSASFYAKRIRKEQKRKTHTKRVYNPSDHSQYVDVEVIDEWHTQDQNGVGQEIEHDIDNSESP